MTYIILFVASFVILTITGIIIGGIITPILDNNSNLGIGRLIGGVLSAIATFCLIKYFFGELTQSYKITILLQIVLNGARALYVASVQDKTGDMKWGELNVQLQVNKQIPIGFLIGATIAYFL